MEQASQSSTGKLEGLSWVLFSVNCTAFGRAAIFFRDTSSRMIPAPVILVKKQRTGTLSLFENTKLEIIFEKVLDSDLTS